MKFALKVVGPGILLFIVAGLMHESSPRSNAAGALGALSLFWLWLCVPIMGVYIVARIWKRATRDSDPYHAQRP